MDYSKSLSSQELSGAFRSFQELSWAFPSFEASWYCDILVLNTQLNILELEHTSFNSCNKSEPMLFSNEKTIKTWTLGLMYPPLGRLGLLSQVTWECRKIVIFQKFCMIMHVFSCCFPTNARRNAWKVDSLSWNALPWRSVLKQSVKLAICAAGAPLMKLTRD